MNITTIQTRGEYGTPVSRQIALNTSGEYDAKGVGAVAAAALEDPRSWTLPFMPYIAIGEGSSAYDAADFTLEDEKYRKLAEIVVIKNSYFAFATFAQDEPTEDIEIYEVGLFDSSDLASSNMARRWVFETSIDKGNLDAVAVECILTCLHGG